MTAIVLSAIYVLWMYQRTMTGPRVAVPEIKDLNRREVGTLAPLMLGLVLFGFFPMPLLNVINPTVEATLQQIGVTDQAPAVSDGHDSAEEGHQ